ncbi:MAG: TonB-dependent receptor [Gammaproteobacteria bacterium]|nr:TonB-dependent receptor [Gammaproteobacteria bacterium]MBT3490047.1 TonB-dependent receptor [Gammaproteobacteria bacterium]MBT3845902.1 TonB-dependent receptor [Gammaproteobacteria bacterium]MBT3893249.1 TonB-dependent receptor [Gammaproteobacteria bacterium]MBT4301620.1 TonB-dependent receptor [Gammaproteobacteria bacterium]
MRQPLRFTTSVAVLLTTAATPALAADQLPDLVVSATRTYTSSIDTSANIVTINRGEISRSGAETVTDLLRGRGGIHISDGNAGSASIDMRGFGATALSNTLIMVDGRKLNSATDGATLYLNSVDLDLVEQVEIVQGSSGILFGNQAVGGMINIITRKPDQTEAAATINTGSMQQKGGSAMVSRRLDSGLGYRFHAKTSSSDQYRDRNRVELENISLRIDQDYSAGNLFAEIQIMDENIETPGALFASELAADRTQAIYNNNYIDTQSDVVRVGIDHMLNENWTLLGEIGHKKDDRKFIQSFRATAGSLSTQDRTTTTINPRVNGNFSGTHGDVVVTVGLDQERTDYKLSTSFGPQNNQQKITALYAQVVQPLSAEWSTTVGYRHAEVENRITGGNLLNHDNQLSAASVATSYRPNEEWRLFLRADQNYRFAKVDEHTNPVFGQPLGVKDQSGLSLEAGAQFSRGPLSLLLSSYQLTLNDEIGFDASGFSNINLDETRRKGFSMETEYQYSHTLHLGGSYDFVDSEISSGPFKGKSIPLVPEHRARLFATWSIGHASSLLMETLYVGEQTLGSDYANTFDRLDSYQQVNLVGHHAIADWTLSARLNNLFNSLYSETASVGNDSNWVRTPGYNPSPTRNLALTATYHF